MPVPNQGGDRPEYRREDRTAKKQHQQSPAPLSDFKMPGENEDAGGVEKRDGPRKLTADERAEEKSPDLSASENGVWRNGEKFFQRRDCGNKHPGKLHQSQKHCNDRRLPR